MDKRHLEYIVAVAEHEGFTAAAAALHVSQSALSQGIAQVERHLGVRLFARTAREVRLTAAGESVLGPARQALRGFSAVEMAAAAPRELAGGLLEIATLPTLTEWPAAALVAGFRRRHPRVRIHLRGPARPRTVELAEMVHRGICEIGLTEHGAATEGLIEDDLGTHDYVALLPPGYAVPPSGTVALEEVLALGLVVGPWWETSRPYLALREAVPGQIDRAVAVRIDHREGYVPLVLAGAGAAFLPRFVAEAAAPAGAVVADLEIEVQRHLVLVRREEGLSPAAQAAYEIARELFPPLSRHA